MGCHSGDGGSQSVPKAASSNRGALNPEILTPTPNRQPTAGRVGGLSEQGSGEQLRGTQGEGCWL